MPAASGAAGTSCPRDAARSAFDRALQSGESAEALDGLGDVAHFQGRQLEAIELKERAFGEYSRRGLALQAARAARWLAFLHGAVHGNRAAANGWLRRAEPVLEGEEESIEHGRLALDRAPWTDNPAERERHARDALAIARRFGDRDLEFSAQALLGHAYVLHGRADEGMSLIDEAMAAVAGGEVVAIDAIGEIYCRLLGACERTTDVKRAEEWIGAARRFVAWGDFWLLEGSATFEVGSETIAAHAGDYLFGPRDIPHRYTTGPDGCRMLFIFTPGGFEDLLRVVSRPAASRTLPPPGDNATPSDDEIREMQAAIEAHGCELLG